MRKYVEKKLKKFLLVVLTFSVVISSSSISFASNTVAGQEMRTQVLYLAGIIDDDNDMNAPITRAQFAKMITLASKYKDSTFGATTTSVYDDVPMSNAYAPYIKVATEQGYIVGHLGGKFAPSDFVTYIDLIRAVLTLLGYTNEDFSGNQILGRYQMFSALELNENVDLNKTTADLVTKLDIVNVLYNTLKAKQKSGQVYGTTVFNLTTNTDGELNASGLLKVSMKGPYILKRGQTLYNILPFSPQNANLFMNGTPVTYSTIASEVGNTGFVIVYYNETTHTVYAYKEGTSPDTTVRVMSGYITHIYYNASDNLTPNSVEIEQAKYNLGNSDMKFAFAYAGTFHVGDRIVFIYQKSDTFDTDGEELGSDYAGTITSAFMYDLRYN